VAVLEVAISNPTKKLFQDARRWLEGSNGQTKLVVPLDVQEAERRNTSNDKWELSEIDFQKSSHDSVSDHILQWYRSKGIRLVGSFKLSVHLWYSDDDRQCIFYKNAFSPSRLIDLSTIEDVPLRLEHLMPGDSNTRQNLLLFPLNILVSTSQKGLEDVETQRASDLTRDRQKRYLAS
jgi:hypothetical protein